MPDESVVASVRLSGKPRTDREVYAQSVYAHYKTLADPDAPARPDARMKAQAILIEALCALGERLESEGVDVRQNYPSASDSEFRDQVMQGIDEIKKQIADLQTRSIVTPEQAKEMHGALDSKRITQAFSDNVTRSMKPGKIKG